MALWKDSNPSAKTAVAPEKMPVDMPAVRESETIPDYSTNYTKPSLVPETRMKESVISADLNIEGKIEGSGDIRIAGRFKGDVNVQGNLTIEAGATLTGGVRAKTVAIGGHLEGNIDAATRVDLLATGVLIGDLTADSLTVAAGSRMRGKAEFGWPDSGSRAS
jgi:cytoskeletal protein CcmA (bactofilin family)